MPKGAYSISDINQQVRRAAVKCWGWQTKPWSCAITPKEKQQGELATACQGTASLKDALEILRLISYKIIKK